jgi:hypothetical protein
MKLLEIIFLVKNNPQKIKIKVSRICAIMYKQLKNIITNKRR